MSFDLDRLLFVLGLGILVAGCDETTNGSAISFDGEPRSVERSLSGSRFSVSWIDGPKPEMTITYPARVAVSDNRLLQVVYSLTGCVGQDVESFARVASATTAKVSADCRIVWADDSQRRVQVATFSRETTAKALVRRLGQEGISANVLWVRDRGRFYYRVTTEPYRSPKQLFETMRFVRSIGYRDAFMTSELMDG